MNAEAIHNTSIWHMGRSFISHSLISWPPMSTKGEQKGQLNPLKKAREQTGRKQIQTNTGQQNLNRVVKVRPQNPPGRTTIYWILSLDFHNILSPPDGRR